MCRLNRPIKSLFKVFYYKDQSKKYYNLIYLQTRYKIEFKINQSSPKTMIGCLKDKEIVNRDIKSKYFTPMDMIPGSTLSPYFSGATYIMHRSAIFKFGSKSRNCLYCSVILLECHR